MRGRVNRHGDGNDILFQDTIKLPLFHVFIFKRLTIIMVCIS